MSKRPGYWSSVTDIIAGIAVVIAAIVIEVVTLTPAPPAPAALPTEANEELPTARQPEVAPPSPNKGHPAGDAIPPPRVMYKQQMTEIAPQPRSKLKLPGVVPQGALQTQP